MSAAILPKEHVGSEGSACIHGVHFETGSDQRGNRHIHANDAGALVGCKRRNIRDLDKRLAGDLRRGNCAVKGDCGNGQ